MRRKAARRLASTLGNQNERRRTYDWHIHSSYCYSTIQGKEAGKNPMGVPDVSSYVPYLLLGFCRVRV